LVEELGSSLVFILEALASLVLLALILAILGSWFLSFVTGGYKEIWKQIRGRITLSAATTKREDKTEAALTKPVKPKGETMPDEHSEFSTFRKMGAPLRALTSKPLVVRSFAWAAVFAAFALLVHPTIVSRFLHQSNYLGVFVVIALLFGLSVAKLTEQIYVRTKKPSLIEATGIILTNSEGRPLGSFGQSNGDPYILLGIEGGGILLSRRGLKVFDGERNLRATLEMTDDGPQLTLMEQGEEAVRLDPSCLNLVDTLCSSGSVSVTAFEEPGIEVKDSEGNVIWRTPTPA